MRVKSFGILTLLASNLALSSLSGASVIYDNGPVDLTYDARWSDETGSISRTADDFVLQADVNVIRDVHWWGVYRPNSPLPVDNFFVRIYADVNGSPTTVGSPLHEVSVGMVDRNDTGIKTSDLDVYVYSTAIPDITLTAGTMYWLSIVNNVASSTWYWSLDEPAGANSVGTSAPEFSPDTTTWFNEDMRLAFTLTDDRGAAPAPTTLVLLGLGLAGIGYQRRRQTNGYG